MKVIYDKETDTLSLILRNGKVAESDEPRPGMILDYDRRRPDQGLHRDTRRLRSGDRARYPSRFRPLTRERMILLHGRGFTVVGDSPGSGPKMRNAGLNLPRWKTSPAYSPPKPPCLIQPRGSAEQQIPNLQPKRERSHASSIATNSTPGWDSPQSCCPWGRSPQRRPTQSVGGPTAAASIRRPSRRWSGRRRKTWSGPRPCRDTASAIPCCWASASSSARSRPRSSV